MTYEDWAQPGDTIIILEEIDTTGYEDYYPVTGDTITIKLSEQRDYFEVTALKGFSQLQSLIAKEIRITPNGNLEAPWVKVTDHVDVQIVMVRQTITKDPYQKHAPYPIMICFTWRLDGNIDKSGLEGGGW